MGRVGDGTDELEYVEIGDIHVAEECTWRAIAICSPAQCLSGQRSDTNWHRSHSGTIFSLLALRIAKILVTGLTNYA
jgi:hypothetical protein